VGAETSGERRQVGPVVWARKSETTGFSPAPGITVQPVVAESLMTCWITMEPGAEVALHHHPNEQLGVVVDGSVTVHANGESRTLETGDAYAVASDLPHHAVAGPNGVVLVETFVPVREDYYQRWQEAGGA
jgi:quercetin dioxygenase-like cupin family protein